MARKLTIKDLADVIMFEIPGEPSRSEGAIECAIRLLRAAYATDKNSLGALDNWDF